MLAAAHALPPAGVVFDGMNLIPLFENGKGVVPRTFYWRTSNEIRADALRLGDMKYIRTAVGEFLFNLAEDPYESVNLKDKDPTGLQRMKNEFLRMDKQMLPPFFLPTRKGGD